MYIILTLSFLTNTDVTMKTLEAAWYSNLTYRGSEVRGNRQFELHLILMGLIKVQRFCFTTSGTIDRKPITMRSNSSSTNGNCTSNGSSSSAVAVGSN